MKPAWSLHGARGILFTLGWLLAAAAWTARLEAQQQFQGVCAQVKIEIRQELTLERIGFLATLEMTNNVGDADFTDFSAALTFENPLNSTEEETDDASSLFFVQPPVLTGISAIDGTGILPPGVTARVEWFIIPKIAAGGESPNGIEYLVGLHLGASVYGSPVAPELMQVIPDRIRVHPEPQLRITYFQPRDVTGDNPFTVDIVEAPIPFTLGVLVENIGFGTARNLKIASEQPRIVENNAGLLLIPALIGSRVDDEPTDEQSLTVNLGDIVPGGCRKGAWDMITSLSGEFTEFSATYTHATELGGESTSLITELNAYFITHEVLNDLPGRDSITDFLAEVKDDGDIIPDTLFETDCNILPVNHLDDATVVSEPLAAIVSVTADFEGWVYIRVDDPGQALLPITEVVRSDGKVLDPHNAWTSFRYDPNTNARLNYLHIFDYVALGDYEYDVAYEPVGDDTEPPVTTIRFFGESELAGGIYYILPETQVFFTVVDESPVGIVYRLDGEGDFVPAYPFEIDQPGTHTVEYYSTDLNGNQERTQSATVVVSGGPPDLASFELDADSLLASGASSSTRPDEIALTFQGDATSARLDAEIEIFSGVLAWPTVDGFPSSPTSDSGATLAIGGDRADYYRFRLNGGDWSAESPIADPLVLTGLSGAVVLEVNARDENGAYLPDEEALSVAWTVSASAPGARIAGPPAPDAETSASFDVTGIAAPFRHQLDDGPVITALTTAAIPVSALTDGAHVFRVGPTGVGPLEGEDVVEYVWSVDRNRGTDVLALPRIRFEVFEDIAGEELTFVWDGRNDDGVLMPAGWYTLRLTLRDQLDRVTRTVRPVRIGDLTGGAYRLSDSAGAPQRRLQAAGHWAVWQDQRSGDWDIWALDLCDEGAVAESIAPTPRNQENPATDGRYAVWEERQPDGTWDIAYQLLGTADPAGAVTATPDTDERSPSVDWPFVVYQAKPVAEPDSPWQLWVRNMLTGDADAVDPSTQDQLDPVVFARRVAWQDLRDPGAGEIYVKDLKTEIVRRVTSDLFGQFHPSLSRDWLLWTDSRDVSLEIYGTHLKSGLVRRFTDTPENESRPVLNGDWMVFQEDSEGVLDVNFRLMNLTSHASVQLTNVDSRKENGFMAGGVLVWEDERTGVRSVFGAPLPALVPIARNRNLIPVTGEMVTAFGDAYTLLERWQTDVGVVEVARATSFAPVVAFETATWSGSAASGPNFALEAGTFLNARFPCDHILDLGFDTVEAIDLGVGSNVLGFSDFPDGYSAFALIRELGPSVVQGVRMLDGASGRWRLAGVDGGALRGENFDIPRTAVLILNVASPVTDWTPGR